MLSSWQRLANNMDSVGADTPTGHPVVGKPAGVPIKCAVSLWKPRLQHHQVVTVSIVNNLVD